MITLPLRCSTFTLTAATLAAPMVLAGDWPSWRGARGDNVSSESSWSSSGSEAPLWSARIGRGYSAPVIAAGKLVAVGFFEDEADPAKGVDRVQCFDVSTGESLWSIEYPTEAFANEHAGGTISTPTIAGEVVYVPSRGGEVRALSMADGSESWRVDLVERHEVDPSRYGFASSPYVVGETLVLCAGPAICLDRSTGETLWVSEPLQASYSTVQAIQLPAARGLVAFGKAGLVVLDAESGETLSSYLFTEKERNVEGATPIVQGTRVFISSGYEHGGALVDFAGEAPEELWRTRRLRTKMAGATLWNGHFYGFDESMLMCVDMQGEERWRQRGLGHGALSIADGRLLLTSSKGELIVADASPDGFVEHSRRKVIEQGVFWTAPVLSDGVVFMRGSEGDLVALDHRRAGASSEAGGAAQLDGAALAAEDLLERHLSATGLSELQGSGIELRGTLNVQSLGLLDGKIVWKSAPDGRWSLTTKMGPPFNVELQRAFDGTHAWSVSPFQGAELLEGGALAELRSTHGLRSLLEPYGVGLTPVARGPEVFRGSACQRVDLMRDDELVRQVYFAADSGRLEGRTGPWEATVVLGDWRESEGGPTLPYRRTEFETEKGEEFVYTFDAIEFVEPADEDFAMPEEVRALLDGPADSEE